MFQSGGRRPGLLGGWGGTSNQNVNVTQRQGLGVNDLGNMDTSTARMLAVLEAMKGSQAAGFQRTASPIGSIATNLAPLFAGFIYAKAAEQQAQAQAVAGALEAEKARADIDFTKAKTQSELRGGAAKQPTSFEALAVQALQSGDMEAFKLAMEGKKAMVSDKPKSRTLWSTIEEADSGDPRAKSLLGQYAETQGRIQGTTAQARATVTEGIKKPLPPKEAADYASMASDLENMDALIGNIASKTNRPTAGSALVSDWVPGGLLTSPFWRDYETISNKIAHKQYGTALSANESKRLAKQWPSSSVYAVDPKGFFESLQKARKTMGDMLKTEMGIHGESYKIQPEFQERVNRLTGGESSEEGQPVQTNGQKGTFMVPRGRETEARKMRDEIRAAGGQDADVMKAWAKEFGWRDFFVK